MKLSEPAQCTRILLMSVQKEAIDTWRERGRGGRSLRWLPPPPLPLSSNSQISSGVGSIVIPVTGRLKIWVPHKFILIV